MTSTLVALQLWLAAPTAFAHGLVHHQIAKLNREIAAHPREAALFVRRGRLWLAEDHLQAAAKDFSTALKLDADRTGAYYFLAQAELRLNRLQAARQSCQRFLQRLGPDQLGGRIRGHVLAAQIAADAHKLEEAHTHYQQALTLSDQPNPDVVLAHVRVLQALARPKAAIAVLDQASAKLGGNVETLEAQAITLLRQQHATDEALTRLSRRIAESPMPAALLLLKGQILLEQGDPTAAAQAATEGLQALGRLPKSRAATAGMQSLRAQLQALQQQPQQD